MLGQRLPDEVAYDGDGTLWKLSESGTAKTRYVTPDYQVDATTGEPTVYYRFGGRVIAWRNTTTLRYLLADHLGSTHGEASETGAEAGQRRYFPFGSDRPVSGANDLAHDERSTGKRWVDPGRQPQPDGRPLAT